MKKLVLCFLVVTIPIFAYSAERLHISASLDTISALFMYQPQLRTVQNAPNEITEVLVSASSSGDVIYMLGESRRTDRQIVSGMGEDYAGRVARGITSSGKVSASVLSVSEEENASITFTLSLRHRDTTGVGHYWAAVRNGKTYQVVTNCMGSESRNCKAYHQRFLETVQY